MLIVSPQAFKHLLDIHVLFTPSEIVGADGAPLATSTISLSLDDETQYRCAGYVQAEIERYVDSLNESLEGEKSGKGSDDENSDEEPANPGSEEKASGPNARKAKVLTDGP